MYSLLSFPKQAAQTKNGNLSCVTVLKNIIKKKKNRDLELDVCDWAGINSINLVPFFLFFFQFFLLFPRALVIFFLRWRVWTKWNTGLPPTPSNLTSKIQIKKCHHIWQGPAPWGHLGGSPWTCPGTRSPWPVYALCCAERAWQQHTAQCCHCVNTTHSAQPHYMPRT